MPELPEVEFAAGRLRQAVLGHTIDRAEALHPSQRRHLPPAAARALAGQRIERVDRRAKVQLIHLTDGSVLEVHFRLNGDWEFTTLDEPPPRHERVRLTTREGVRVSLVDSRALCVLTRHAPGTFAGVEAGPEPLADTFTAEVLRAALRTRRAPIKPVLLDQHVVAGVGNIYASEALWEARIHPATPANTLSAARVARLRDAIVEVLRTAPTGRYWERTTADGTPVRESEIWRVYGRTGDPCRRCGSAVRDVLQAGRRSYWCARCQRR
ncbi:MAG: bifunctional DNA-formamidopyrimidine glycosylase/DNA-(apurinic or apyrimidinic site) lyase [Gemmatimonadaceae bacterium]|nr:bifunctional DNA-formamidopyrimidine glycosylase/DNA-(apurinic or apyrimidinic site) lyase [Gemmatimonadaceae bacterium]